MKILALEVPVAGVADDAFTPPLLEEEAAQAWALYQSGDLRELHFRADWTEAVLVLECADVAEARRVLATLPLVREKLIDFELMPGHDRADRRMELLEPSDEPGQLTVDAGLDGVPQPVDRPCDGPAQPPAAGRLAPELHRPGLAPELPIAVRQVHVPVDHRVGTRNPVELVIASNEDAAPPQDLALEALSLRLRHREFVPGDVLQIDHDTGPGAACQSRLRVRTPLEAPMLRVPPLSAG